MLEVREEAQQLLNKRMREWKIGRIAECLSRIEQSKRDIERYESEIEKTEKATEILENRGDRI